MNRTFSTLKNNVGNRVQDTDTDFLTIIGSWINNKYAEILNRFTFLAPVRTDYTLSVTAGTQDYQLPDDFGKALFVLDQTNNVSLEETDIQSALNEFQVNYTTSGEVTKYLIKQDNVATQPTSASTVSITSSSASDTTQTVLVRGFVSSREAYESVTLTGTTPALTTNSYDRIISISKSATTVGRITGTSNSGAVTVFSLAPTALIHRVKKISLFRNPASNTTLRIPYTYSTLPLSDDLDYPIIECSESLELGATAEAWRYKKNFAKAADYDRLYEESMADLAWKQEASPNRVHRTAPNTYSQNIVW